MAITLSGSDVDGDGLAFTIVDQPAHGALSGIAPDLTYTPVADYNGPDSFTFLVNDGALDFNGCYRKYQRDACQRCGCRLYCVCHNCGRHFYSSNPDGFGCGWGRPDLRDCQPASPRILSGVAPNLTYLPAANYYGADSFTFVANDGTLNSAPATIYLTVTPVNDAPLANAQSLATQQDTALAITLGGSDVDGDALTYQSPARPPTVIERERSQPDIHARRRVLRSGQLHLHGFRRPAHLGGSHDLDHGQCFRPGDGLLG